MIDKRRIIVRMEPSKRLSALCGFPYFVEQSFTVNELLKNKVITQDDVLKMEVEGEIQKNLKKMK